MSSFDFNTLFKLLETSKFDKFYLVSLVLGVLFLVFLNFLIWLENVEALVKNVPSFIDVI